MWSFEQSKLADILYDNFEYVNEGFNPHLSWRNKEPLDMINSNKNIYMLLHPHWWYQNHPFE